MSLLLKLLEGLVLFFLGLIVRSGCNIHPLKWASFYLDPYHHLQPQPHPSSRAAATLLSVDHTAI